MSDPVLVPTTERQVFNTRTKARGTLVGWWINPDTGGRLAAAVVPAQTTWAPSSVRLLSEGEDGSAPAEE